MTPPLIQAARDVADAHDSPQRGGANERRLIEALAQVVWELPAEPVAIVPVALLRAAADRAEQYAGLDDDLAASLRSYLTAPGEGES